MPQVHDIGKTRFIQVLSNYKVQWGWRFAVRGWTQEIEPPYRVAAPVIFRLPNSRALVYGKWVGEVDEESALNKAIQGRVLTDDDFSEENGWVPAPDQAPEESSKHLHSRVSELG